MQVLTTRGKVRFLANLLTNLTVAWLGVVFITYDSSYNLITYIGYAILSSVLAIKLEESLDE